MRRLFMNVTSERERDSKNNGPSARLSVLLISLVVGFSVFLFSSCGEDDGGNKSKLIVGKWLQSNVDPASTSRIYWRYRDNGTGVTWDENLDTLYYVGENESNMTYTWSIYDDVLTHTLRGEEGNVFVQKIYTIKEVGSEKMVWEDRYGEEITLRKK